MAETTPILTSLGESLKQNVLVLAQPYARNFSIMNSTSNRPQEAASMHVSYLNMIQLAVHWDQRMCKLDGCSHQSRGPVGHACHSSHQPGIYTHIRPTVPHNNNLIPYSL